MNKSKFNLNKLTVAIVVNFFLLSCSSNEDSDNAGPVLERTKIIMETPVDSDIDWNNVKVVWNEEFGASTNLDDIWVFETKNTTNPDIADQLQTYSEQNVSLSGEKLKISAKKENGSYSSAKLSSKYAFQYGRIEMSVKLPEQEKKGIWAKLALIGDNQNSVGWPQAGEIDFMEYFSYRPNEINIIVHTVANSGVNGTFISTNTYLETAEEEFHAYGILWTDKYIKFYIDDPENIIYTLNRPSSPTDDNWPFDKPFYLIADMVIGGRYAGAEGVDDTLFPATMEIDYIRVYHPQ